MSASTILTSTRGLVRSSAFLAATLALAATLPLGVSAATPLAVWDRDFSTMTSGTFTLSENGNTKGNGYLQISGDNGILLTSTDALNVFTVIARCEGLDLSAENIQVLFTSYGAENSPDDNKTGVILPATNAACRGIWASGAWDPSSNTAGYDQFVHASVPSNYTTLIYNHQQTNGTYAYALGPTSDVDDTVVCTTLYSILGLRSSGTVYKGCAIGGLRGTTSASLLPATGLKITSLAVFSGTLSEADMKGYIFPSEIQNINVSDDTTVSAINAQCDSTTYKAADVTVANGVMITVNEAFSANIRSVSSAGTITLSATSQPDASYLSHVDFSGVQGGLLRSWLTPGVVGFNFNNNSGGNTSGALAEGTWHYDANSANGTSTAMFADGLSTLTWASKELWSAGTGSILSGYLDDGAKNGHGAEVYLSNIPYATYDVIIYCNSDSGNGNFHAKTVNGTTYTWDSAASAVVDGNAAWGKSNLSIPVYGVNALRIKNLTGPLSIYGGERVGSSGTRGGIAAIQIMPPDTPDNINYYTLTLNGAATTWSNGTWTLNGEPVSAPTSGYVKIVATSSTALTVDSAVSLADLVVTGAVNAVVNVATNDTGSLFTIKTTVASGVFQQGSPAVLGATPTIVVEDGATFDLNGQIVNGGNLFKLAGAGAGNWPWSLTSSGGEFPLGTLREISLNANATIGGANRIRFGLSGSSSHIAYNTFTLRKTGACELVLCNGRSATGSVGTLDVAEGEVTFTEFTCIDGYEDVYAHTAVIVREGATIRNNTNRFIWMDSLNWLGGEVISANPFAITNAFEGSGTTAKLRFASGAQATLTGDLVITNSLELGSYGQNTGDLSLVKAAEVNPVTVTVSGTFTSAGSVSVGAGVTLNLGTNRPTATFDVDSGATLSVRLQSNADVVSLSVNAQPTNLVVYDADGVPLDNARVTYSDGVLTIMAHLPTLPAVGTVSFDTPERWEDSLMPSANGDAIIELSGDAEITVSGTYALGNLTVSGNGAVSFSGEGAITAANISLKNGATLVRNSKISVVTGIVLDSGTVLRLNSVTESAAISGAGAVETYGTVVLAHANTMTGGITVKPGSALSASVAGAYGEYQTGWAYSSQRQVVVEDGGTVDINYIANADSIVALTIAGKGVLADGVYSGAVTYSGANALTGGSRQLSSLVLTGDALVDLGAGWGLVHHQWGNARLGLNRHTLTVRGTTTFPLSNLNNLNGAATTGTLVLDGATLELTGNAACNLAGVDIISKGCASNHIATAPSALGSFTLKPSASGTIAGVWNLPSGCVPSLDTSNIDPAVLTDGQVLTLFTAPAALSSSTISVNAGARFTTEIVDNTVIATVKAGMPANYVHYDFNAGTDKDTARAADSFAKIDIGGEAAGGGSNGRAAIVYNDWGTATRYTPYWDTYTAVDLSAAGKSPLHAGEMTVTAAAKLNQTNMILWGLGTAYNGNAAIGLVSLTATSAAIVTRDVSGGIDTVVTISNTEDLTKGYHFFAVVANGAGTKLYVDNALASSEKVVPQKIGQYGQLGSFHNGAQNVDAPGANLVGAAGFLLDDFRIYDATLSQAEIRAIKREVCPDPLFIRLR